MTQPARRQASHADQARRADATANIRPTAAGRQPAPSRPKPPARPEISGAGGGQVLVSLGEAAAELMFLLGKVGHLLLELADVIGLSEAGLAPDLLAESIGEAVLELADAGGQAGGALVGGEQVGLQRGPGDRGPGCRLGGRQGLAGVDLGQQVAVPVEEGAVHPGFSELGDEGIR